MNKWLTSFAVMLALSVTMAAPVADKKLQVGSPAPVLTVGRWIKGEPVTAFEKGKIYVVEFWATWCAPCRMTMPHLSELQAKYKDKGVVIIGQNCSEADQSKVAGFVEKMGAKMDYRVALDDVSESKNGKMNTAWMDASGQDGIPTAFVVDKEGKIAWIGHPLELGGVLEAMVAGVSDPKKLAVLAEKSTPAGGEDILGDVEDLLADNKLNAAWKKSVELVKDDPSQLNAVLPIQYEIRLKKNDAQGAAELGKKMYEALKDDAEQLVEAASRLRFLHSQGVKQADLNLAEKMAQRAHEITKGGSGAALNELAMIYMEQGQYDQALKSADNALSRLKSSDDEDTQWEAQLTKLEILWKKKDYAAAEVCGKQLIEASKNDGNQLEMAIVSVVGEEEGNATKEDVALAEKLLKHAEAVVTDADVKSELQQVQIVMLMVKKDYAAVKDKVEQLLKAPKIEVITLERLTGRLLSDNQPSKELLDLAAKVMERANEITKGQEAEIRAGLADIYYMKGDLPKARETLENAIAKATDPEIKKELQERLAEYKNKPKAPAPGNDEDDT